MIRSFRGKAASQVFNRERCKELSVELQRSAYKKLLLLDAAGDVEDLRIPPSNHLEKLKGDRAGQYSVRINLQWRLCFHWRDGHAHDVEIVDYH